MSKLYNDKHRHLQDEFNSREMADRVEDIVVVTEISDDAKAFMESRDMFFLSSVDERGRPTVSYKGGEAGHFIKVLDDKTFAFPSYDGNGMYYSMGNIQGNPDIGLLFIDFEKPHRIRVQGKATASAEDPLLSEWKEAEMIVRVTVSELWQNCPRYVHRYQKVKDSRYIPKEECKTPIAAWKRVDIMQDVLRENELSQVSEEGGTMPIEEWVGYIQTGDEKA
ncbi:MAG TPA: pyridoxamine 5'-phosphate oxidase family protein [Methylophaga aminisulfidivorans]|uniref:Pyridoxamine 5'-phosphate oxidase family protein n=1 Tax=Methylophaga aminisulfidivorans TaxID=230105 RepID=A0A7C1ZT75_9GAMM|nr:pyridoxamine 5'-phosphate oxidase family protein [Methylophaga aminisulfidivorans]